MTTEPTPEIHITYGGRPVLTVEMAATRYGRAPDTIHSIIRRQHIEPAVMLDGRKALYYVDELDAAYKGRPGKAWRAGTGKA